MNSWEQRRLTITADDLLRKQAPQPSAPPAATPLPASWLQRKLAGAGGWPWREIGGTVAVCVIAAVVIALIVNSGLTLPSLPRRRPAAPTVAPTPIIIERQVEVQQAPVIIVVTATPMPAPVQPVRRAAQPLPPPTQAPPPAAWPAPQPVTQAYGCVGLGPCNPPKTAPTKVFAGYQCADGRFFPADGPWGMFGFGTWIVQGEGDIVNIRDTTEPGPAMGWHNHCSRVWR